MIESLPTVDKEIGGVRFRITKLPYAEARTVLLLLSRKVFPALREALKGVEVDGSDRLKMRSALTAPLIGAIADVLANLTEADLDKLEEIFGNYSSYANGTDMDGAERWARMHKESRDKLFSGGRLAIYVRWIAACVEVTFGDFFADLVGPLLSDPSS